MKGQYEVATVNNDYIYLSSDSGVTWAPLTASPQLAWTGVAISSNGAVIHGCTNDGYIYTSIDGGSTFNQNTAPLTPYMSIACDNSGQYAVASQTYGNLFYTTNGTTSPNTWSVQATGADTSTIGAIGSYSSGIMAVNGGYVYIYNGSIWDLQAGPGIKSSWAAVAIDSNNYRAIAAPTSGNLWINNFGTWTELSSGPGTQNWKSVSISANASIMVAGVDGGSVWLSIDFGTNWTEQTLPLSSLDTGSWTVVCGGNGTSIIASSTGGNIGNAVYYYTVSTSTWNLLTTPIAFTSVDMDVNGQTIIGCNSSSSSYIYISTDSGNSWTAQSGPGQKYWGSVSLNNNASYMVACVKYESDGTTPGYIWTWNNGDPTWTEQQSGEPQSSWISVSMYKQSDSVVLAIPINTNILYISNDYGVTWDPQFNYNIERQWKSVAFSSASTYAVACVYGGVWVSSDSGANWTENFAGPYAFNSVAISSNGQYMITGVANGQLYLSTDFGATWNSLTTPADPASWTAVAISDDGQTILANADGAGLYTSSNQGTTWTLQSRISLSLPAIKCSSTATTVLTINYDPSYSNTNIYNSTDTGVTWTTTGGQQLWSKTAFPGSGTYIVASTTNGNIWVSSDSGANWAAQPDAGIRNWVSIGCGNVGDRIVATNRSGDVYYSFDSGVTWSTTTVSGAYGLGPLAVGENGLNVVVGSMDYGYIYTSTYLSSWSWSQTNSPQLAWIAVACSFNAQVIAATDGFNMLYTSTDNGSTWGSYDLSGILGFGGNASYIAVSGNGFVIAAIDNATNNVYISTDSGSTFNPIAVPGATTLNTVALSSDGTKIIVTDSNVGAGTNYIYTSIDSGANWVQQTSIGTHPWNTISISHDDTTVAVGTNGEYIYKGVLA